MLFLCQGRTTVSPEDSASTSSSFQNATLQLAVRCCCCDSAHCAGTAARAHNPPGIIRSRNQQAALLGAQ